MWLERSRSRHWQLCAHVPVLSPTCTSWNLLDAFLCWNSRAHWMTSSLVLPSAAGSQYSVPTITSGTPQLCQDLSPLHHLRGGCVRIPRPGARPYRLIARQLDHPQSITWEGHSANPVPEAICHSTRLSYQHLQGVLSPGRELAHSSVLELAAS